MGNAPISDYGSLFNGQGRGVGASFIIMYIVRWKVIGKAGIHVHGEIIGRARGSVLDIVLYSNS